MRHELGQNQIQHIEDDIERYVFFSADGDFMAYLEYHTLPEEWDGPNYYQQSVHDEWMMVPAHSTPSALQWRVGQALAKVRHESRRR